MPKTVTLLCGPVHGRRVEIHETEMNLGHILVEEIDEADLCWTPTRKDGPMAIGDIKRHVYVKRMFYERSNYSHQERSAVFWVYEGNTLMDAVVRLVEEARNPDDES